LAAPAPSAPTGTVAAAAMATPGLLASSATRTALLPSSEMASMPALAGLFGWNSDQLSLWSA
jgi:hypothetical protein